MRAITTVSARFRGRTAWAPSLRVTSFSRTSGPAASTSILLQHTKPGGWGRSRPQPPQWSALLQPDICKVRLVQPGLEPVDTRLDDVYVVPEVEDELGGVLKDD